MNRLSRVFVPVGALALLFSEILLIAACFLVAAYLILPVDPTVFLFYDNGLLRIALAGGSILFGLYFEDLYAKLYVTSRVLLIQQLSLVMGIALLAQGILGYVSDGLRLPLRLMLPTCAVLVLALFAWRVVYSVFVLRVVGPRRILLVGMSPLVAEMCGHIGAHPELGLQVIGYLDDGAGRAPGGRRVAGTCQRAATDRGRDRARPHRGGAGRTPRPNTHRRFAAIALRRVGHRRGFRGLRAAMRAGPAGRVASI